MARKHVLLPESLPPMAVNEPQAAAFINVSPRNLRTLVEKRLIPPPRALGGRKVWLVEELAAALRALPVADAHGVAQ
jgi:hypothetical protein